jgi:hypothetical protein
MSPAEDMTALEGLAGIPADPSAAEGGLPTAE